MQVKKICNTVAIMAATLGSVNSYSQNIFPASGKVGIGTTSPDSYLHIVGAASNVELGGYPPIFHIDANTFLTTTPPYTSPASPIDYNIVEIYNKTYWGPVGVLTSPSAVLPAFMVKGGTDGSSVSINKMPTNNALDVLGTINSDNLSATTLNITGTGNFGGNLLLQHLILQVQVTLAAMSLLPVQVA